MIPTERMFILSEELGLLYSTEVTIHCLNYHYFQTFYEKGVTHISVTNKLSSCLELIFQSLCIITWASFPQDDDDYFGESGGEYFHLSFFGILSHSTVWLCSVKYLRLVNITTVPFYLCSLEERRGKNYTFHVKLRVYRLLFPLLKIYVRWQLKTGAYSVHSRYEKNQCTFETPLSSEQKIVKVEQNRKPGPFLNIATSHDHTCLCTRNVKVLDTLLHGCGT